MFSSGRTSAGADGNSLWLDVYSLGEPDWKFGDGSTVPDFAQYPLPEFIDPDIDLAIVLIPGNSPRLQPAAKTIPTWPLCEKSPGGRTSV